MTLQEKMVPITLDPKQNNLIFIKNNKKAPIIIGNQHYIKKDILILDMLRSLM
jgi:hypothetical protein